MALLEQEIIGIDGGGTSTVARLYTIKDGSLAEEIAEVRGGPANINSVGIEQITETFRSLLVALNPKNAVAVGLGLAGLSTPGAEDVIKKIIENCGYPPLSVVRGDHEMALRGALGHAPGILLISGTGSICYGQNDFGEIARSGGYGYLLDDGGSAFSVGLKLLRLWIRTYDGRIEMNPMIEEVGRLLSADSRSLESALHLAYGADFDKSRIARISQILDRYLTRKNPLALDIAQEEILSLIEMVKAVSSNLNVTSPRVVLHGGFFEHNPTFKNMFATSLPCKLSGAHIIEPECDAVYGAARWALEEFDGRYASQSL